MRLNGGLTTRNNQTLCLYYKRRSPIFLCSIMDVVRQVVDILSETDPRILFEVVLVVYALWMYRKNKQLRNARAEAEARMRAAREELKDFMRERVEESKSVQELARGISETAQHLNESLKEINDEQDR